MFRLYRLKFRCYTGCLKKKNGLSFLERATQKLLDDKDHTLRNIENLAPFVTLSDMKSGFLILRCKSLFTDIFSTELVECLEKWLVTREMDFPVGFLQIMYGNSMHTFLCMLFTQLLLYLTVVLVNVQKHIKLGVAG